MRPVPVPPISRTPAQPDGATRVPTAETTPFFSSTRTAWSLAVLDRDVLLDVGLGRDDAHERHDVGLGRDAVEDDPADAVARELRAAQEVLTEGGVGRTVEDETAVGGQRGGSGRRRRRGSRGAAAGRTLDRLLVGAQRHGGLGRVLLVVLEVGPLPQAGILRDGARHREGEHRQTGDGDGCRAGARGTCSGHDGSP